MYQYTKLFPKKDRYSLGVKVESLVLELLEQILFAGNLPKLRKIPHLEQAIILLETLKLLIRLSYHVQAIDYKKYESSQLLIQEIGKMLGGWKKSLL